MQEELYEGKSGSEWVKNGQQPGVCQRCDGCKQIANNDEAAAWWVWKTLPRISQMAVTLGFVSPIPCPKCNGTGTA